ncbi:MAG: tetratricopeptide repeat protein [Treponema sp.]|jgi:tetratricopeptide (TPR) repeat protein|nr:tetratricopeptide repeat protein [Treponema sp.]
MKIKQFFGVFLVLSLLISCHSSVKKLSDEGYMYAMIYDYDSLPVTSVTVYLNGIRITDSDIQGRFVLEDMKKGRYSIKLVKRGYETFEDVFEYLSMEVLYFKIINANQLLALAELAMDNNEFANAENFLNRALALEPNRPDILFLAGVANNMQGKTAEAIILLERIIRLGNADPSAIKLLEMIKQQNTQE